MAVHIKITFEIFQSASFFGQMLDIPTIVTCLKFLNMIDFLITTTQATYHSSFFCMKLCTVKYVTRILGSCPVKNKSGLCYFFCVNSSSNKYIFCMKLWLGTYFSSILSLSCFEVKESFNFGYLELTVLTRVNFSFVPYGHYYEIALA